MGRRLADDRATYRWSWRGELVEATLEPDADSPYAGHQVRWLYDAIGRLTARDHYGPLPDGAADDAQRPFIERRAFLWDGWTRLGEAGYADPGETRLRWRITYLPGPSCLDDALQAIVEIVDVPGSPYVGKRLYTYLRDEMGSVVGIVAEDETGTATSPPVPVRYRHSPYGETEISTVGGFPDTVPILGGAVASADGVEGRFPGGQNLLFQGLWVDPVVGVAYARHRWLDVRDGVWLSEDPMEDVDSPALYAFARHDPVNGSDPLGLCYFGFRPEWLEGACGFLDKAGETAVATVSMPVRAFEADAERRREKVEAYLSGGYEASQAVEEQQLADYKSTVEYVVPRMVPGVGTYIEVREAWERCQYVSRDDCGAEIFDVTFSVGVDVAILGNAAKPSRGVGVERGGHFADDLDSGLHPLARILPRPQDRWSSSRRREHPSSRSLRLLSIVESAMRPATPALSLRVGGFQPPAPFEQMRVELLDSSEYERRGPGRRILVMPVTFPTPHGPELPSPMPGWISIRVSTQAWAARRIATQSVIDRRNSG